VELRYRRLARRHLRLSYDELTFHDQPWLDGLGDCLPGHQPALAVAVGHKHDLCVVAGQLQKFLSEKPGSRTAPISVFLISIFITMVYSLLQAEPSYSIPFRPFEILLAFTSVAAAHHFWSMRNRLADQTPLISP